MPTTCASTRGRDSAPCRFSSSSNRARGTRIFRRTRSCLLLAILPVWPQARNPLPHGRVSILNGPDHEQSRNHNRRQGHEAARALPDGLLLRRLSRPRQRRLRRADDEPGSRPVADRFGFGAGIFFIAYFIFEVPSNLLLERFGARKWIARIMFSWGILSGAMAFIPDIARATGLGNEYSFYLVRVLLGVGRGRLLPRHHLLSDAVVSGGLSRPHRRLLHGRDPALDGDRRADLRPAALSAWRPRAGRLAMAVHHRGAAGDHAVGRGVLLSHRPAGRRAPGSRPTSATGWPSGWQPSSASARRCTSTPSGRRWSIRACSALSLVYFGAVATNYGLSFFLPQIVKAFGLSRS